MLHGRHQAFQAGTWSVQSSRSSPSGSDAPGEPDSVTFPERSGRIVARVSGGGRVTEQVGVTPRNASGLSRLGLPAAALMLGCLALALAVAAVPLARLAHQSLNTDMGSLPVGHAPGRRGGLRGGLAQAG